MVINMDESKLTTIAQIEQFVAATPEIEFSGIADAADVERYAHVSRVLKRFDYPARCKRERGVLRHYLCRTTGYSRAQITRLITRWGSNRLASIPLKKRHSAPSAPFVRKYTVEDIDLLVEMDQANVEVCGPAISHLFKRALHVYGDARYVRLAELSVSHLYNLRQSAHYRAERTHFVPTHAVCNLIGIRPPPRPQGRAGFIRVDSVHQGGNKLVARRLRRRQRGLSHHLRGRYQPVAG